jgi:hypothetical protein
VTVGYRDDGSLDRRHLESKSKATVIALVRQLERDRDNGSVRRIGQRWTVESWLQHWLENIARPSIRDRSFNAYRVAVNKHLIPGLGKHRLERLEPEHLEKLYQRMIKSGARPGTAHQCIGRSVRRWVRPSGAGTSRGTWRLWRSRRGFKWSRFVRTRLWRCSES